MGCAHSPEVTAAPSEPLLCYVQTCWSRVSTKESWRQPPAQCILVSGLPPGVVCRDTERGARQGGVSPSGVMSFLLLWMSPVVLGLGPLPAGSVAGPHGFFQLTGLALLPTGCSHHGQVLHLDLGGRMGPGLGEAPTFPPVCPAPLRAFTALCHQGWSFQPYLLSVSQFASEIWGYFVHDVVWKL